ncbi:unnamed protein product [Clavelina lepadiformis]|uniref:Uncharacterized protein n=1 Tax=Clavelina lepadiformis TaxID=159417 RepID=A0ABP0EVS2_CLALP
MSISKKANVVIIWKLCLALAMPLENRKGNVCGQDTCNGITPYCCRKATIPRCVVAENSCVSTPMCQHRYCPVNKPYCCSFRSISVCVSRPCTKSKSSVESTSATVTVSKAVKPTSGNPSEAKHAKLYTPVKVNVFTSLQTKMYSKSSTDYPVTTGKFNQRSYTSVTTATQMSLSKNSTAYTPKPYADAEQNTTELGDVTFLGTAKNTLASISISSVENNFPRKFEGSLQIVTTTSPIIMITQRSESNTRLPESATRFESPPFHRSSLQATTNKFLSKILIYNENETNHGKHALSYFTRPSIQNPTTLSCGKINCSTTYCCNSTSSSYCSDIVCDSTTNNVLLILLPVAIALALVAVMMLSILVRNHCQQRSVIRRNEESKTPIDHISFKKTL